MIRTNIDSQNSVASFEVRDIRQSDWVWSHKKVLFCPFVNASDYKVYSGLSAHAGNVDQKSWASYDTLSSELNLGRSTVIRSIKTLIKLKLISARRRQGTSNIYYLLEVPEVIRAPTVTKEKSTHHQFIQFFYETAQKARGFKPQFSASDTSALKRVLNLNLLTQDELEQITLFYLADSSYSKFSPSIATLFSHGILNSFINKIKNDRANFWKQLETHTHFLRPEAQKVNQSSSILLRIEELHKKLSVS